MKQPKITVVIPAAGLASRLRPISNHTSKAMIPINGKPAISYIIDEVKEYADDIRIVYGKSSDILEYCNHVYSDLPIKFYHQDEALGPLHAIYCAIKDVDITHLRRKLLIWLGDTIVLDYKPREDHKETALVYSKVNDWERWCLVDDDLVLHDKPKHNPRTDKALVGIYELPCLATSKVVTEAIIERNDKVGGEFQISQLLNFYLKNEFHRQFVKTVETNEWYDCGDFPSLYESRARLINRLSREDNIIKASPEHGTISKYGERCVNEIQWYKAIGNKTKPFVPAVYEANQISYTMELCSGTSLQDIFVYEKLRKDTIAYTINRVIDAYENAFCKLDSSDCIVGSQTSEEMWINKNIARLNKYNYEWITSDEICMITQFLDSSEFRNEVATHRLFDTIHGDAHFGNILFDYNTGKVKFIDPRGEWAGKQTTIGDIEYDIAKMYQSVFCEYMWIVNNMQLDARMQDYIVDIMDERFGKRAYYYKALSAVMMSTCIPFHNDDPKRQRRIWHTSLEKFIGAK